MMQRRIAKETAALLRDPPPGTKCVVADDNIRHFHINMAGPPETPYEGGIFKMEIFIPDGYPMVPPKARFLTKIYHPNIDKLGRICLDILKNEWTPAMTCRVVLLSIQVLLATPNPEDPLAADVAQHWLKDLDSAISTAREWTDTYAKEWLS